MVIDPTLMKSQFIAKYQIYITYANEKLTLNVVTIVHDHRLIAAAYANSIIEHNARWPHRRHVSAKSIWVLLG